MIDFTFDPTRAACVAFLAEAFSTTVILVGPMTMRVPRFACREDALRRPSSTAMIGPPTPIPANRFACRVDLPATRPELPRSALSRAKARRPKAVRPVARGGFDPVRRLAMI